MRELLIEKLLLIFILMLLTLSPIKAEVLKLSDVPLNQFIELYAKKKGCNIFLDESVQGHRKITAHLNGLDLDKAFKVVLKTINLETCELKDNTIIVFPPEKSSRYKSGATPLMLEIPDNFNADWIQKMLRSAMPGLKTSVLPDKTDKLVIIGTRENLDNAEKLIAELPKTEKETMTIEMSSAEAGLTIKELNQEGVRVNKNGLEINRNETELRRKIKSWRNEIRWGNEVFYPENLDFKQVEQIAQSMNSRAIVSDLGNTGACFVEGPAHDRRRLIQVFEELDRRKRIIHKEISPGDIDADEAKKALKAAIPQLRILGKRNLVLIGRPAQIDQAENILEALGKRRAQVLISFKLAEISRSKLKTLGINLDKNGYSYDEIKEFHGKDTLPLLLKLLNEGKDAKILAEPNLRVIEGEEAKVTIGDRIPLEVEATATTDSGSLLKLNTQLQWVDVGIKMRVKDVKVGPDKGINMKIMGEVSSVVSQTRQGYPQIRTREAESTLRVQNGDSIVMGGLINKVRRKTRTKIPVIDNIPILGSLTGSRDKTNSDSEIIILVNAKIIED
ncbi:MAG: hypothetical protein ACQETH_16960 [Candidatus Rifleibacteriota bacterium]